MSTRPAKRAVVQAPAVALEGLEEKFKRYVAEKVQENKEAAFLKIFGDGRIVVSTAAGVVHRSNRTKDTHDWFDAVLAIEDKPRIDVTEPFSD